MTRISRPKIARAVLTIVASCFLCSCGSTLDDRLADLVTAKDRWIAAAGESHYSYELRLGQKPPFTVSVSNPGTLRDDWLGDVPCSAPGVCGVNPSMRELYELVLELTNEQFESGGELRVEYDAQLGFPTEIYWDNRKSSHSAVSIGISNVILIDSGISGICGLVRTITLVPMNGDGDDTAYIGLIDRGTSVLPALAECVSDQTPMPDPREAPHYNGTTVGDIAFWTFVRIADVEIEDFLPEDYRARWDDEGIYAYFDYVSIPENRLALQASVQRWIDSAN